MGGTITGGQKAAMSNKLKYGEDFYSRIGKVGGKLGHTGGFAANHALAREAGRKGGTISRRTKRLKPAELIPTRSFWQKVRGGI